MRIHLMAVGLLVACLVRVPAGAVEVRLTVREPSGVPRKAEPVTTGVPFAKGAVRDVANLAVFDAAGRPLPAQFRLIAPWPDGSVRWALMDTQVDLPAGGETTLVVREGTPAKPEKPLSVLEEPEAVTVSTGPLRFRVSRGSSRLLDSLRVDGREVLSGAGLTVLLYPVPGGKPVPMGPVEVLKVEEVGPLRAVILLRGRWADIHEGLLHYTCRITAYAGRKYLKVHFWLENQGKYGFTGRPEWFNFDGLAVELRLGGTGRLTIECEGRKLTGHVLLEQRNPTGFYDDFVWTLTADGREVARGVRTEGVVRITGGSLSLTTVVRHFWQNYEKAVEVTGDGVVRLWLWPIDGEWPRSAFKPVTGEFMRFRRKGLYALEGARHKGHEFILDFSGRDPKTTWATLSQPLMALAEATYYATTEAVGSWFAPPEVTGVTAQYNRAVRLWNEWQLQTIDRHSRYSLYGARRSRRFGRWYGWHDFGDLFWQPGCSSLHYDWTWLMLLDYLRFGRRGFFEMGLEMARHRIDLDQVWSDRVDKAYRGLQFYEKGYWDIHGGVKDGWYKPIPSHNWISGVVLYYFLTGEEKARECALRNGMGIKLRQVDRYAAKPSPAGQTRSTGWSILALCSLYDLTADRKYLDWAMTLFNNHIVPQWRKFGPYLQRGLQYYYSTQGLCELHHRTGDAKVFQLLKEGCENINSFGRTYPEWKIFLSNIFAYVGYKTGNRAYILKAEELFSAVIPRRPIVFTGNGAWTKEAAKPMRNGHILQYVEWKMRMKRPR